MSEHFPAELLAQLPGLLVPWFLRAKRDLEWRNDPTPYRVWISEIMLQQTRVEAVKPYYDRFLAELPDVAALAAVDETRLLKLWEGLGYYRRARNLQAAAKKIMHDHGGVFPSDYDGVRGLPGIGDYTAGAILSIAFGKPFPAVDGNVLRVVSRVAASREDIDSPKIRKELTAALAAVYLAGQCSEFTQSLMELGATVCVPNGEPHCADCPLNGICRAHMEHSETDFPVRKAKKPRRIEEYTVYILECYGEIAIRKRQDTGLLAGLFELPHLDGKREAQAALDDAAPWNIHASEIISIRQRVHIFTHIEWHMACVHIRCMRKDGQFLWVTREQLHAEYALPTAFRICLPPEEF